MGYTLIAFSPSGKGMAFSNIALPKGTRHGKKFKKMDYKRYNVNQN